MITGDARVDEHGKGWIPLDRVLNGSIQKPLGSTSPQRYPLTLKGFYNRVEKMLQTSVTEVFLLSGLMKS